MQSNRGIRIFDKATAIVTGGASGIGRALAEELAEKVVSEIRSSGGKATAVEIDVTDFPAMERLVQETVGRTGRLDYIFNNAGIVIGSSVNLYGIKDWNQVID